MISLLKYSEIQQSEFFHFFNLHEIERSKTFDASTLIKLKTGGFQEYIDIMFEIKEGYIQKADLYIDRKWIGDAIGLNPFGKDIAKSFIIALTPKNELDSINPLAHSLFNLKGKKDIIIYINKQSQIIEKPSLEILSFLKVYLNLSKYYEFPLYNSKFIIENIIKYDKPCLSIKWLKN
jgi:hypothetical protein